MRVHIKIEIKHVVKKIELEITHVENEFDASATDQPFMVHEVEKFDSMVFSMDQDKAISFATLIPPIDFIIPDKFNNMTEQIASLFFFFFFFVLPKVLQELLQVSSEFLFLNTSKLDIEFPPTRGE